MYEPHGSLQFQTDPTRSAKVFDDNGMVRQASVGTAVYEARDAKGAQGIVDGFFAEASPTGKPVDPVKQLPNSRCLDLSQGRVTLLDCLLTADRYAIEAQSAQSPCLRAPIPGSPSPTTCRSAVTVRWMESWPASTAR